MAQNNINQQNERGRPISVILDSGSYSCKAGFAGNDAPTMVLPTVVGRPVGFKVHDDRVETYVGDEASNGRLMDYYYPIKETLITNFDDLEKIWLHTFCKELRIAPEETPMVIAEPVLIPRATRERIQQIMFEAFNVPAIYSCPAAVLSLVAAGQDSGVVVDSGEGVTRCVPVIQHDIVPMACRSINIGGGTLTEYLMKHLVENGHSFSTLKDREIVNDMKEKICYVTHGHKEQNNDTADNENNAIDYELPDGSFLSLDEIRFRCPEVMFSPWMLGMDCKGIHEIVHETIMAGGLDDDVNGNIVLSGGNTMFDGFAERLEEELSLLLPNLDIVLHAPSHREYSVFVGGSALAASDFLDDKWYNKKEYDAAIWYAHNYWW